MTTPLLGPRDPAPVEIVNPEGRTPLLLVCEHAGQAVPEALGRLGVSQAQLDEHIGWDIGAAEVTRRLAAMLDAPAVLQRYSRLVIDCNRPPEAPDSCPPVSDGHVIPGNAALDPEDRVKRVDEIFRPFQGAVATALARPEIQATFSIHSYTPVMGGIRRAWDVGFLFRSDRRTSDRMARALGQAVPGLTIGLNQPYQVDDASDWFVPRQAEPRGLPPSLHIRDAAGQTLWAERLAGLMPMFLKEIPA
ncbi:N-formylglutamate amidohydrolase [Salipiger sp. HF18]|uniref:N-formylglutamate amidohydrolase n=1 Tax=Salipiger sp. HF18 TaxID=2721557 RepID=UPI00142E58B5|nr:N-formylglutamate amidohydrolase [Salipiger sp. HF18]NIY98844.1 N-formylglutamate amidohydrolase [Salipiger sp. HF18]